MSLKFVLASVDLALHGWLFRDTYFIRPSELEANDSTKISFVQNLNNPIKVYDNKSIYYFMLCFFV